MSGTPQTTDPGPETPNAPKEPNAQLAILEHLKGEQLFTGGPEEFPDTLDLGEFEPHLSNLRDSMVPGYVYTEEQREQLIADGIEPEVANQQASEAELSRMIYLDRQTGEVRHVDSTDNHHSSVKPKTTTPELFGNPILIGAHTHPAESIPSISDYGLLLAGVPESGARIENSMMILNPDSQIIALATSETPVLEPEKVAALIQEWQNRSRAYEDEATQDIKAEMSQKQTEAIQAVQELSSRQLEAELSRILSEAEVDDAMTREVDEDEMTREEMQAEMAKIMEAAEEDTGRLAAKFREELDKAIRLTQVQFVKALGFKLYKSTDFRHFDALDLEAK